MTVKRFQTYTGTKLNEVATTQTVLAYIPELDEDAPSFCAFCREDYRKEAQSA
jgi:hypothetical protein